MRGRSCIEGGAGCMGDLRCVCGGCIGLGDGR